VYLFARRATTDNPKLAESLIKAHAEAIKRFYEDKAFAVKAYIAFDKQTEADVSRIYDLYKKGNIFERVPYVMAGAVKSTLSQQADPRIEADLKAFDFRKIVDNSVVDKLVKEGFFQQVSGPASRPRSRARPSSRSADSARDRMHKLDIVGLTKRYYVERDGRQVLALSDVSLSVADGEFMAIVGPSGCGKTSLLNIVAGLLRYDSGSVIIDGKKVDGPGVERAVVFQQSSLLPWRTVTGNVRYGMEMQRRFDRDTMRTEPSASLSSSDCRASSGTIRRSLSGGMQQRVNLARALAADPVVLLMDEPFAALDAQTREFMQAELLKIWSEAKKTVLFITHQINEAVYLADRVAVMSARPGRVKGIVEIRSSVPVA
jgi:NitT/TauT family transport system ATP-binding protein